VKPFLKFIDGKILNTQTERENIWKQGEDLKKAMWTYETRVDYI